MNVPSLHRCRGEFSALAICCVLAALGACSQNDSSERLIEGAAVVDALAEPIQVESFPLVEMETNGANVPVSQNVLQDGSFERPEANQDLPWSTTAPVTLELDDAVRVLDGVTALRVDVTTDQPFSIQQDLKTEQRNQFWVVDAFRAGAPHWLRGYIRSEGFEGAIHIEVWDIRVDGENLIAQSNGIGDSVEWTAQSLRFTAPVQSEHLAVRIRCQPAAAGGSFWLDDFELRQVEGERKKNLLKNPSFEERSPEGPHVSWNLRGGASAKLNSDAVEGASSLQIGLNGKVDLAFFQRVDGLSPGSSYVFSAYIRTNDVPGPVTLWVQDVGPVSSAAVSGTASWTELSVEFTQPPKNGTEARVYVVRPNGGLAANSGGVILVDGCALYER